jgi:fatty acid desaturase
MKSFIVEYWAKIFNFLRWVSPFQVIRAFIPATRGSKRFVEGWVLGNLLLSFVLLLICSFPNLHWWEAIAVGYGAIRVFEVFIYQINVLIFDEYRATKSGKSYPPINFRRSVLLLLHNYAEIIFWFALFYRNIDWVFKSGEAALDSFFVSLNFSFVTMTTFGHTAISPTATMGDLLVLIESGIGLVMALLIVPTFVSLLLSPET